MPGYIGLDAAPQRSIPNHDAPAVGDARFHELVSAQEVAQALSLLQPADEEYVDLVVTKVADRRMARMEQAGVDSVRDDLEREFRKVAMDECLRRLAHRDPTMQVGQVWLEQRSTVEVADVGFRECVERANVGCGRQPEHGYRQRGHKRLVEMEDVEPLAFDD